MQKIEIQQKKGKRIYFVEFLWIFLILSIFLVHVGDYIDNGLEREILAFFGTGRWYTSFAVQPFFIIGGFFLYGRLVRAETIDAFADMGKLWLRGT